MISGEKLVKKTVYMGKEMDVLTIIIFDLRLVGVDLQYCSGFKHYMKNILKNLCFQGLGFHNLY